MSPKPSGPPTPRPPATMIRASSMDAAAPWASMRSTIGTAGCVSSPVGATVSTLPALAAASAVTVFGRTVTMPRPPVSALSVMSLPPNTLWVAMGPSGDPRSAIALASTPRPVRADRAPARSRPSGPAPARTTSGSCSSTSAASRWATIVPAACSAVAGSVTARTRGTKRASSAAPAAGSAPITTPVTSAPPLSAARARASVATSVESLASEPSAASSPWTQMPAIR